MRTAHSLPYGGGSVQGVSVWGSLSGGSLSRGVSVGGFSVQGDPLPPVDRHTLVKTLPCPKPRLRMVKIIKSVPDPEFSRGGCANSQKELLFFNFFAENCMKMKEFGPQGWRASLAPSILDPPMKMIDTGNSLMGKK